MTDPEQWGWKLDGTVLTPVMTDMAAAPAPFLFLFPGVFICIELYIVIVHSFATLFYKGRVLKRE